MVAGLPALASAATRTSLVSGATKVSSSLVALRGGGSIGPLDANTMVIINLIVSGLYVVEMAFPSLTNPSAKYYGLAASPWTKWFGLALLWHVGLLYFCKYQFGVGDVDLLKYLTLVWVTSLAMQAYEIHTKAFKTKETLYICAPIALLTAYIAYS